MTVIRMNIGNTGGDLGPAPEVNVQVDRLQRYHRDLECYLVAILGFAHAVESVHGQPSGYSTSDTVRFCCKQSSSQWYWRPEPTISMLAHNWSPHGLFLERFASTQMPEDAVLNLGPAGELLHTFGQALATNYFERHKHIIKKNFGSVSAWPPVWNFARVVRNAMAHGGRISIQNPADVPVTWMGLSYSAADNGREILHSDLWPGDLFDLLIAMDDVLPAESTSISA